MRTIIFLALFASAVSAQDTSSHVEFADSLKIREVHGWSMSTRTSPRSSLHVVDGKTLRCDWDHEPTQADKDRVNSAIVAGDYGTWLATRDDREMTRQAESHEKLVMAIAMALKEQVPTLNLEKFRRDFMTYFTSTNQPSLRGPR